VKKILDATWFTAGSNCIGIVIIQDLITKEKKAYIGLGKGLDEGEDATEITSKGNQLPLEILQEICAKLKV